MKSSRYFLILATFLIAGWAHGSYCEERLKKADPAQALQDFKQFSLSRVPAIPHHHFSKLKELKTADGFESKLNENIGWGNDGVWRGEWQGHEVCIKYPNRADGINRHQVAMMKLLSDLRMGPYLYGITYNSRGKLGIVTEFISGIHFAEYTSRVPPNFVFNEDMLDQLEDIEADLARYGIFADDIQLRIGLNGRVYLIDPEKFKVGGFYDLDEAREHFDELYSKLEEFVSR